MSEIINPQFNFTNLFTFSQSSLQDYTDCPRRFQLKYINRLVWPAVEMEPIMEIEQRMLEGQMFHRLAQQAIIGLPIEQLDRLACGSNLKRWWEYFLKELPTLKKLGNLHTEISLSAPLGKHRLIANYDLVSVHKGKAIIYDWKTSQKRPRDEWMSVRLQTLVYRYLLVVAGAHLNAGKAFRPEHIQMVYWYTDFPSKPARFSYSSSQYKRDTSSLEKMVADIVSATEYPQTKDDIKCRFCHYRSFCERGTLVGDWQDAETDLDDGLTDFEVNLEQIAEIEF